jgi:hypothetical protein
MLGRSLPVAVRTSKIGLLASAFAWLLVACTGRTPGYCDLTRPELASCPGAQTCDQTLHACLSSDGGGNTSDSAADAGDHDGGDGAADVKIGCTLNQDCTAAAAPVCQTTSGLCVGCLADADCKTTAKPVCDTTAKSCVACLASKDCPDPTAPVCDSHACRSCIADAECPNGPGVCMFHQDGRCATDAETIYVQKTATCPGSGSAASPFCKPQDAINALSAMSSPSAATTLVLRGPMPLGSMNVGFTLAGELTVIGQAGAYVFPGVDVGLQISDGAQLYVRGLTVTGGANVGMLANGNAVLRLDRCLVTSNAGGGIQIDGAGFDIINTVIAKNGPGSDGPITWGGFLVSSAVPAGNPSRFVNNTVVDNNAAGASCVSPYAIGGSISFGNITGDGSGCTVTTCCTGDPLLTTDYHLMSGSPCIDQLAPALSVPDDIDGQVRPQGASLKSDCGADEYVPPAP